MDNTKVEAAIRDTNIRSSLSAEYARELQGGVAELLHNGNCESISQTSRQTSPLNQPAGKNNSVPVLGRWEILVKHPGVGELKMVRTISLGGNAARRSRSRLANQAD